VAALGVDEDDVTPTATFRGNLGAESIDLLDIVFRLEREFRIEIPRGELFPDSMCDGRPDLDRDVMTAGEERVEVRTPLPYADLGGFAGYRRLEAIAEFFTVGQLARYIAWKLARQGVAVAAVPATAASHRS
jgi:acyl carrier protein